MLRKTGLILILILVASAIALPTAVAQDIVDYCAQPLDLIPDQIVYSRPGVFFRAEPSISGGQINYYQDSITFRVLGGPVCADGQLWWNLRNWEGDGWITQGQDLQLLWPGPRPGPQCDDPLPIAIGTPIAFLESVRLRTEPSLNASVIIASNRGESARLIDGPVCANEMNWWKIEFQLGNVVSTAWVSEGRGGEYYIIAIPAAPPTPQPQACAPPFRRLGVGIRSVVQYLDTQPKNVRLEPDREAEIAAMLLEEVVVDILEGPVCSDGLNWWKIQVVGRPDVVGWMAEGGTAARGYWLVPLDYRDDFDSFDEDEE